MADGAGKTLTEQQKKWFASITASMREETGKTLDEWVEIAKTTPETTHGKRVKWFKAEHGLGQNRASVVLMKAFPSEDADAGGAGARKALWKDAGARSILEAIEARLAGWDGLVSPQRKGYTPWARNFTFASAKPIKGGVLLGLAVPASADARLTASRGKEGWSDRLTATVMLTDADEVDDGLEDLLKDAFDAS
jgi:hypothetical protein